MSSLETLEYIQQEMAENPILELREKGDSPEGDTVDAVENDTAPEVEWWEYFLDRSDLGYIGGQEP